MPVARIAGSTDDVRSALPRAHAPRATAAPAALRDRFAPHIRFPAPTPRVVGAPPGEGQAGAPFSIES